MPSQVEQLKRELFVNANPHVDEPIYYGTKHEVNIIRKYLKPTLEKIKGYFKEMGIMPSFRDTVATVSKLPTARNGKGRIIGKVFANYEPREGMSVMRYDPAIIPEMGDPQRDELYESGMLKQSITEAMTHEGVHHVQKKTGALREYAARFGEKARDAIEGLASYFTSEITGIPQLVYVTQQHTYARPIVKEHGRRKATTGRI